MTSPLRISFDVACSAEHAFNVWTSGFGTWWPPDHTVTGEGDVVFEGRVGGRIFERAADGVEHDWGEIVMWDPPKQLVYRWHIGADRADATEVQIRFIPHDAGLSRVEIEHRGWDRLGPAAAARREQNRGGWEGVLVHFRTAAEDRERGDG
jgi:uncharacterized protein YndB with AHSA1/START domain